MNGTDLFPRGTPKDEIDRKVKEARDQQKAYHAKASTPHPVNLDFEDRETMWIESYNRRTTNV